MTGPVKVRWRGINGEVTAEVVEDRDGHLFARTRPDGRGIPLEFVQGSPSFEIIRD